MFTKTNAIRDTTLLRIFIPLMHRMVTWIIKYPASRTCYFYIWLSFALMQQVT